MMFFQKTVHSENWSLPCFCPGSNQLLYTKSGHHCINAQLCPALHQAGSVPALPHSIGSLQFRMADSLTPLHEQESMRIISCHQSIVRLCIINHGNPSTMACQPNGIALNIMSSMCPLGMTIMTGSVSLSTC